MKIAFTNNNDKQSQETSPNESQTIYQNPQNLTDNIAPDTSTQINTNFDEQRIVETQQAYPHSNLTLSKAVEAEMADGTWFARQQLMKPVQLAQVDWTTTQPRNTDIYAINFPAVMETVDSIFYQTLRMYAYYKISPCFRVQINTTQFHQGQLICSFDPFSQSSRDATLQSEPLFDHIYATGLPNIKIMASESDAVELCVPFVHPRSFLTTNQDGVYNNLGAFRITVLNPLVVASGTSPTVSVTIWVYAKDAEVHVPVYNHAPELDVVPVEPTSGSIEPTSGIFDQLTNSSFGGQLAGFKDQITNLASPIISAAKKGAGQVHTMYGNVVSGNIGQALRTGQGLVDTLGDLFGFDYPARTLQPPKTISPVENLSVGIGQSQSQRMAIDPFSMHLPQDDITGESMEAMNLMKIAQMPMLLSQFSFKGTDARDTLLFSAAINPTTSAYIGDNLRRTYLSFVSNAFAYWSGGINYDIEVVATRFHSGKLIFAFVPNTQDIPTYAQAATSLPNVIIDLQQTSSIRFKIPYVSSTPVKAVQRYNPSKDQLPPNLTDSYYIDSTIGTLVCYVQNTLTYASNVAPSVELNLYVSAGDDFSLYVPVKPFQNIPGTVPTVEATSNQIGINLNKNNDVQTQTVLSKDQNSIIPRKLFGEQYGLIDLLRRFTFYKVFDLSSTLGNIAVTPQLFEQFAPTESPPYLCYFSQIYSAFSGSIRYKIISNSTRNENVQIAVTHYPSIISSQSVDNINLLGQDQGFATLRTVACQDAAIEAEVPYYSRFNMLLLNTNAATTGVLDLDVNGILSINTPASPNTVVDSYIAAGEDFRYIYIRAPPIDKTLIGYTVSTL